MKSESLQYYIHDEPDALRLELSGSLSGEGAQSVYQAWRTALSIVAGRPVIADITFVAEADERGRGVLQAWRRNGVRIVAGSPASQAVAGGTPGERISAPPGKQGRVRRWISALFGGATVVATSPAPAESRIVLSAPEEDKPVEFAADFALVRTECRLP
jgi:hypothetical protein